MLTYADVCMLTVQHHVLMLQTGWGGADVDRRAVGVGVGRVCGGGRQSVGSGLKLLVYEAFSY